MMMNLQRLTAVTLAGTGESHCTEGVANTRAVLSAVDLADLPVACGVDQPIGPGNEDDWRDAADRLDRVTIIALAPLTNLAVAVERHDGFAHHVARVVTMRGAIGVEGIYKQVGVTHLTVNATGANGLDDMAAVKAWID
jgi:inosine-uridine nucleoside N-ribohydrolase